jgi:hypothetical protein
MLQRKGGVTYVHNSTNFTDTNSMKYCKEQDIETSLHLFPTNLHMPQAHVIRNLASLLKVFNCTIFV